MSGRDSSKQQEKTVERGATRSGARFAARNVPFYASVRELLSHHQQLLQYGPVVSTRHAAVGSSRGTLMQTTIRFRPDHPNLRQGLRTVFSNLFRLLPQGSVRGSDGFEVVVTFNAIVTDSAGTSYSVFYGHDYGSAASSGGGVRRDLRYGGSFLVLEPDDVDNLPVAFDFERLAQTQRLSFENSDLRVVRFLNVVYLAYQYSDGRHSARYSKPRSRTA